LFYLGGDVELKKRLPDGGVVFSICQGDLLPITIEPGQLTSSQDTTGKNLERDRLNTWLWLNMSPKRQLAAPLCVYSVFFFFFCNLCIDP
jgi:hypothetical protein